MPSRQGRAVQAQIRTRLRDCAAFEVSAPRVCLGQVSKIEALLRTISYPDDLEATEWLELLFLCSSLQINAAGSVNDLEALAVGADWAREALTETQSGEPLNARAAFNLANALSSIHEIGWRAHDELPVTAASLRRAPFRLQDRENLRMARSLNSLAAGTEAADRSTRSMALCNLANSLDESDRWVEAYERYVEALQTDPSNGNAAGNAAELLRRRIGKGRGLLGHYAAVYDEYVLIARSLRNRTVEVAGEATAQRWDRLQLSEGQGHVSHDGDKLNEYQRWIKENRLALTPAVEGLGSDDPRWDTATVEKVKVTVGEPDPPLIFASMNVLKAEFLVCRKLAFQGESMLGESIYAQHPGDSGFYVDTLDYSYYGESPAMLVLAQRATLDLLDKIAVAANSHFMTRLQPGQVNFRGYWFDMGSGAIRRGLPRPNAGRGAAVALSELSFDLHAEGLYPSAQLLRNAGTHRLVRLTHGDPTGVTPDAHSSVDAEQLISATHQSLKVARAAYLYLIDLVAEAEEGRSGEFTPVLSLPEQR